MAKGPIHNSQSEDVEKLARRSRFDWADRRREKTRERAGVWLGISAVVLSGVIAVCMLRVEHESFLHLREQHALIRATDEFISKARDVVAGERAYLLTGESSYLELYNSSRAVIDSHLQRLRTLTGDNPRQRQQVERLGPLIRERLTELQEAVETRQAAGLDAADVLRSSHPHFTDPVRQILQEMVDEEQTTLEKFTRKEQWRLWSGLSALLGSVSLAVCCLLMSQLALNHNISVRRKAEEELRASERRFEALCDQAPVGIFETDAEGHAVFSNRRWSQISGLDSPASRGDGWLKAVHPEDRAWLSEIWKTAARQGISWEYRLVAPQGTVRWARALGAPIHSETGELTGYVGTIEDVTERKQAEQALEANSRLNRSILDSLPANIAMVDREGSIRAVNEGWECFARENGGTPTLVLGAGVNYLEVCRRSAMGGSLDATEALAGLEEVLQGSRSVFKMQYPCPSNSQTRWFRMIVSPLTGAEGGAVISHVDYTDVKQAEERFRLAVEASPSGMVIVDQEGKIVLVNKRVEELFGYGRQELLGQLIEILVPEPAREKHAGFRKEVSAQTLPRSMGIGRLLYARRKDGTQFPVEIGLNPIETEHGTRVLSSITDITERRRAEEERQKFVSLADRSLEFISMCDLDFKPFYVNAAGMRVVGLDNLDAARRGKVQDYFFPEDQPFIVNEFLPRVLRVGNGSVEIRFRHFKTGEAIWMLYNVFNICDSTGRAVGLATVSVNVTERKRAERSLQESRQELEALSGRLLMAQEEERKRISRELHDDLSQRVALLAFDASGLVLRPHPSPADMAEMKTSLCNLRTRITELSTDIRQIAHQLHPSILEDLGLTAALHELCEEFSGRDGLEVVLDQHVLPEAPPVDVASCLYRVAQEALYNVQKHARANHVRLTLSGNPGHVCLSVQDDGVGFDPEVRAAGHGLGIVSIKERVRLVHGEVSIGSQPGQGTTLTVSVPLPKKEAQ